MADIDEAEAMVRTHQGIENDEIGRMLVRLVREIRGLRVAVQDLRARVTALEAAPVQAPATTSTTTATPEVLP